MEGRIDLRLRAFESENADVREAQKELMSRLIIAEASVGDMTTEAAAINRRVEALAGSVEL